MKRNHKILISHYRIVEAMGVSIPIRDCTHKVGDRIEDSYGTEYEVQKNQSIKRISIKKRG